MKNHIFILLAFSVIALAIEYKHKDNNMFRLPDDLIPVSYDLDLFTDPDKLAFSGNLNITLQLVDQNSTLEYIHLHADQDYITLTFVQLNNVNNCTFESLNEDILKIFCGNITEPENFLYITYDGKYSQSDGYGLVKATYADQGKKYSLLQSYFEPSFARRAFPCFDEPDFIATYSLQISYPVGYTAITNTISKDSITTDDYITTNFELTPKISSYLVSIFVSKFEETTYTSTDEECVFKFLTRVEVANSVTKIAGVYHRQILDALDNFTGQSYQDTGDSECYQVAIPDCYFENMGNFGLFTYRERDLLDDGDRTTAKIAQDILQTMTYKLSHQWFGGEISTKWWSDAWANDAFPVYLRYIIPNQIHEELELTNQFVVEVVQKSMQYDAMPFVLSLSSNESDVDDEWKMESKLDQNSLLKGAALLHMINFMLSDDEMFKANLQYHLQNRKYSDTTGENLLQDLSKSDGIQDLYSASEPWAFTSGFPLLSVKIQDSTDEKETLTFSQTRFVYPVDNTSIDDSVKWTIPISSTSESNKHFDTVIHLYHAPNIELFMDNKKDDWVMFNIQGRFHYRVNYEEILWRRIISVLKSKIDRVQIHTLNRAQLIDDIFNIARIGAVEYSLAFELADFLANETDYYPWYSAFNAFSYLLGKSKDEDVEANLRNYILNLMDNIINLLDITSTENKTHIDVLKTNLVLDWACKLGHTDCINFANEQFSNFKEDQQSIQDYNLRSVIFCNGIRYSENLDDDWRFLWSVFVSSSSVHEQNDILHALGCAENKQKLLNYLLKLAVPAYSSDIKRQDTLLVFKSVFSSSQGIEAALWFLESSLSYIQFIFNGNQQEVYILSDMILSLAEQIATDDHLSRLQNILNDGTLSSHGDLRARANTLAKVNNYWWKQYQDTIKNLFPETSTSITEETTNPTEYTSESSTESTVTTRSTTTTTRGSTTVEPSSTTTEGASNKIFGSRIFTMAAVLLLTIYQLIY